MAGAAVAMERRHTKQIEAFNDTTRFKYLLCGRRGGKTFLMREDICRALSTCPDKGEIFYIGPSNQQAIELMWEPLEERMEELGWRFHPRVSKQRFELSRGRKVYIIGAEKIRRIRGHSVYRVYLDELAFFSTDLGIVWKAVRPALSDLEGTGMVATTPNGKGTQAYDFYIESLKKQDWKFFHWHTVDNPAINPEEIEAAKRELDEKSFRQEYLATWESFEGLAYYNFDESLHIKRCSEFDFELPTWITLDFNVNPTTLIVGQRRSDKDLGEIHSFRREFSQKNSSTVETARSFCEAFKEHKDKFVLEIYGDASGNSRKSATGFSDYYYVQEVLTAYGFRWVMRVPGFNPAIVDRVAHANSYLKNVYGEARVEIDPSCSDLIRDLSSQTLEGRFPSDKNNLGHKGDAFGYYVHYRHIKANSKPQGTVQL